MQKPSKTTTALPRRTILAGLAAAAPAAAIASLPVAAAAEPDPIFAAIAAHEAASQAYTEALNRRSKDEKRGLSSAAHDEECDKCGDLDFEAACVMVSTIPTTLAGAIALMKYSMSGEHRYGCEWPNFFDPEDPDYEHAKTWNWFLQRTLIRSLEYIAA